MSNVNFTQAAEDARVLARQFKAVLSLVDVLDELGRIDQIRKELDAAADASRRQALAAALTVEQVEKELVDLRAAVVAEQDQLDEKHKEASARANDLIKQAEKVAAGIIQAAKGEANTKKAKVKDLEVEEAAVQARITELNRQAQDAEERLAAVRAKIEAILK
jgi:cell division septum initiation protein DivIVA